jgi:fructokinase
LTAGGVLVCGEALIDLTPTDDDLYRVCPGGGPFNTAVGLGRLGIPVGFFGRISTDGFGRVLAQRLVDAGVDRSRLLTGDQPTPLAVVTHDGAENHFAFYVEGTAERAVTEADLPADLGDVAALHVGTVALVLEPIATALETLVARESGQRAVALDPNVRPPLVTDRDAYVARIDRLAALADVVKVSDADAAWLAPGRPPAELAEQWLEAGAGLVVVTEGASGAAAHTASGAVVRVAAPVVTVVDTIGAGDAFNAGLLAWLHDHGRLVKGATRQLRVGEVEGALRFAVLVAGLTCQRAGADPPWRSELPAETT